MRKKGISSHLPLPAPGEKRHRAAIGRRSEADISAAPTCLSPRRGKSAIALPGAEEAMVLFPQRSENTRISVSPMCFPGTARWRRCREATESGRLIQCFPSQAQAPALPTLPRGASQGDGCAFYSLSRISRSISSHTAANSRSISRLLKRNTRSPNSFSLSSRNKSFSFPSSS